MNVMEFLSKVGTAVKVVPEPEQVNAKRQLAMISPNEWRIEGVQDKRLELKNIQSGHTMLLPENYIRTLSHNKLEVRFKIVLKTKRTVF